MMGIRLTNGRQDIEDEVTEQYPRISPPVVVLDVQRLEELITDFVLAVTA